MANTLVGTWDSEWLSYDNNVRGSATVTISESSLSKPSGQFLNGIWDAPNARPGILYGTLSGNTWSGEWWYSPTETGKFTFTLENNGEPNADGKITFKGTYNSPNRTAPQDPYWNGTLTRKHEKV